MKILISIRWEIRENEILSSSLYWYIHTIFMDIFDKAKWKEGEWFSKYSCDQWKIGFLWNPVKTFGESFIGNPTFTAGDAVHIGFQQEKEVKNSPLPSSLPPQSSSTRINMVGRSTNTCHHPSPLAWPSVLLHYSLHYNATSWNCTIVQQNTLQIICRREGDILITGFPHLTKQFTQ